MATVQNLKKKLQVIRSTRKITLAMKTASTVKYSRLSGLYSSYEKYEKQCSRLYETYRKEFNSVFCLNNADAPICYIVMAANKGMCGAFNAELLSFFDGILEKEKKPPVIFTCGKKVREHFQSNGIPYKKAYIFNDVPSYSEVSELFNEIRSLMKEGSVSSVRMVYPEYINMIKQEPVLCDLFTIDEGKDEGDNFIFVPDKDTVINNTAEKTFTSIMYKKILETALGAQAATLTTMRSAYDTACEYSTQLETQINRIRQSQVTADVIEISAEYSMKGEK